MIYTVSRSEVDSMSDRELATRWNTLMGILEGDQPKSRAQRDDLERSIELLEAESSRRTKARWN